MAIKKIVVIGPESTGKSTLSQQLAAILGTVHVPEYAREYLNTLNRHYSAADLPIIAEGQLASEDHITPQAHQLLICDTDLYVIKVWSEHKYGACDRHLLEHIATRTYHMYLLTGIDMPWEDDALREHPAPEMRRYFFHVYQDIVINSGVPWAQVEGTPQQRLQQALQAVRTHFPSA